MEVAFTEEEKNTLYGQTRGVAIKNGCSKKYVNLILSNQRKVSTPLSKKIKTDLRILLDLLTPKTEKDV